MQNIVEEESKLKNFLYSKNELDVSEEKMPSVFTACVFLIFKRYIGNIVCSFQQLKSVGTRN